MAVVEREIDVPGVTRPMTYEEYMAGPEEMARYDIIDGWKVYYRYGEEQLTNPTVRHQRVQRRVARILEDYEAQTGEGLAIEAPCAVQITRFPLRNRQPDVLFISKARFGERNFDDPAPLSPAPELVVEVISPSDKPSVLAAKIADYRAVDVREVWVARAAPQSVELLLLSIDEIETVAVYGRGQTVESVTFPGLTASVDEIFTL